MKTMMVGVIVLSMTVMSQAAYLASDDFSGSILGSQWQISSAGANSPVKVSNGAIETTVSNVDGNYISSSFASAVDYTLPAGNFSFQVEMNLAESGGYYQLAWIMLGINNQNYAVAKRFESAVSAPVWFDAFSPVDFTYNRMQFKFERVGTTLTCYAKPASGETWTTMGSEVNVSTAPAKISMGCNNSYGTFLTIAWDNFILSQPITQTPAFSPSGDSYTGPISISCPTAGATIYYTTDGTVPTTSSNVYAGPVALGFGETCLQAIAVLTDTSWVAYQVYTFAEDTAAPVFSPGGKYVPGPLPIKITCATSGAVIHYTTDGTDPNLTSPLYTKPVTVDGITVKHLKAIGVSIGRNQSSVTSMTYEIPPTYNRPEWIPFGSAVIDGNLSEWSNATWIPLDKIYLMDSYSEEYDMEAEIPQAYYAVRWQANKIYIAVEVEDTSHHFSNTYDVWYSRDAIEIFLHTDNIGDTNLFACNSTTAQQYAIGIKDTNHNAVWAYVGTNGAQDLSTLPNIARAAGKVNGNWLYYEVEITPYTYFGLFDTGGLSSSVISQLAKNQVIGLDVEIIANKENEYMGKKSENEMQPKYNNWANFGLHKLAAPIPGDANGDGMVDVGDLGILAANYGGSNKTWAQGDFNDDGLVDVGDLGILAANYGTNASSSTDWTNDYAKTFSATVSDDTTCDDADSSTVCSSLGLPLIAGLVLMGLMLVKLEE